VFNGRTWNSIYVFSQFVYVSTIATVDPSMPGCCGKTRKKMGFKLAQFALLLKIWETGSGFILETVGLAFH